jgi:hypothetical protein
MNWGEHVPQKGALDTVAVTLVMFIGTLCEFVTDSTIVE